MGRVKKIILVWAGVLVFLAIVASFAVWLEAGYLRTVVYLEEEGALPVAATPPGFRVAMVGDQGLGSGARQVLELIRAESADMVLLQGDLSYNDLDPDKPAQWEEMFDSILGENFPLFFLPGNHDEPQWYQWRTILERRIARVPDASCTGDLGVRSACSYSGLFFLLTRSGTDEAYYREQLARSDSLWKICSWHKNQRATQPGGKGDEVGWGPYEECRRGGAFIVNGHEHSYARTKTLSDIKRQTVDRQWTEAGKLRVGNGATFLAVSGLGGFSIRNQERCLPTSYPYGCNGEWAKIYTSSQGAKYGALFMDFNVDGDERKARGYYKNIDGEVVDEFTVTADVDGAPVAETEVLVPEGANWKYLDDGSAQGVDWRGLSFEDGGWPSGRAPLGYGDGDEATVVSFGANESDKHATTYFRHTFTVTDPGSIEVLSLALVSDDGAVVYLNGNEVARRNMPAGSIEASTWASRPLGGVEENAFERGLISPALLREGVNILAAEVHQANAASSDVSFDLTMDAVRSLPAGTPASTPIYSASPAPSAGISSAEFNFVNNRYYARPGETVEIPFSVTARGSGIASIIARAVFKIIDMGKAIGSFNPVFE